MDGIQYYVSTNKSWFENLALEISKCAKTNICINDNRLQLPPLIGTGKLEFHELRPGISLLIVDCTLLKKTRLNRISVKGTGYYELFANCSASGCNIRHNTDLVTKTGNSLADAFFYSSTSLPVTFELEANQRHQFIEFFFHYTAINNLVCTKALPAHDFIIKKITEGYPLQFSTGVDLASTHLLKEIFARSFDTVAELLYMEGLLMQVFSSFIKNIGEITYGKNNTYKWELEQIIRFVDSIKENHEQPLPSLADAARHCNMGKSKFTYLFYHHYGKNYKEYLTESRMQLAKKLLHSGNYTIPDIAKSFGYSKSAGFIKVYKKYIKDCSIIPNSEQDGE